MNETSSADTLNIVNYVVKNNIISSLVTTVIAFRLLYLVSDFTDCLILPALGIDVDEEEEKKNTKGIKTKLFLVSLLKFIIIIYLVFIITRLLRRWKDGDSETSQMKIGGYF